MVTGDLYSLSNRALIRRMRVCRFFYRATVSTNGNWWYVSALDSMRAKLYFCSRSVNIGPSYIQ